MAHSISDILALATDLSEGLLAREGKVQPAHSPEALLSALELTPPKQGQSLEQVAKQLRQVFEATPTTSGPRFFNQLFGGREPAAVLGEVLATISNNSMYTYKVAGAQVLVEAVLLRHMAQKVGWSEGDGGFTPGGSLSNLVAMMVARNEALDGAKARGMDGRQARIYTSSEAHYSIRKAASILGLGRANVQEVEVDARGRMRVDVLERAIDQDRAQGLTPVMIAATAGTTVLGAFDPIRELAAVARKAGVWLHVDGAFGGSMLLSDRHRSRLDGVELADSVTWDAHKLMGVPLTCSVVLLRQHGLLHEHLGEDASYLFQLDEDTYNPGTRSIQCGRRNDALKLWTAWQHHGDSGYAARIDRLFELAAHATSVVQADPELSLAVEPESVNVCFEVEGADSKAICAHLNQTGHLKIGHGRVHGRPTIRLVCANPDLDNSDIDAFFKEIKRAARDLYPPSVESRCNG